jgi:type I restriction enzyme, S subunit
METEWREYRLGDLGEFRNGVNFSGDDYGPGLPIVNVKQLYRGRYVDFGDLLEVRRSAVPNPDAVRLHDGDILFARSSLKASGAGQTAMVGHAPAEAVFSGFIIRFRVADQTQVMPEYVNYLLRSPVYRELLARIGSGTTITNLSQATLAALPITLPELYRQRAIVGILGALDDKIELNRRMSRTLESMARALFKSWFVDFDPVRAKADGRDPGLPEPIADLFPASLEDSDAGQIPTGWGASTLSQMVELNPSRPLRDGHPAPYLDMANAPTTGHSPDRVVDRVFRSGSRFMNGDTLVARITPCLENGKASFVDFLPEGQVGWGSTEFLVLRPRSPLPPELAYCLARSEPFREYAIQNMSGTSGRQRVSAEALCRYPLVRPPESVAVAFGSAAARLLGRAKLANAESNTLSEQRDSLLPQLTSGSSG